MVYKKLSFDELIFRPFYKERDFVEFVDFRSYRGDKFATSFLDEKIKSEYVEFCYSKRMNKDFLKFTRTKYYKTFNRLYIKANKEWDNSEMESFCDLDLKKIKYKKKTSSKEEVEFRLGGIVCSYYRVHEIVQAYRLKEYEKRKDIKDMETEKNIESYVNPYEPVCSITGAYNCNCWDCKYDKASPRVRRQMLDYRIMFHI